MEKNCSNNLGWLKGFQDFHWTTNYKTTHTTHLYPRMWFWFSAHEILWFIMIRSPGAELQARSKAPFFCLLMVKNGFISPIQILILLIRILFKSKLLGHFIDKKIFDLFVILTKSNETFEMLKPTSKHVPVKANNKNIRRKCETCSKLTIKIP